MKWWSPWDDSWQNHSLTHAYSNRCLPMSLFTLLKNSTLTLEGCGSIEVIAWEYPPNQPIFRNTDIMLNKSSKCNSLTKICWFNKLHNVTWLLHVCVDLTALSCTKLLIDRLNAGDRPTILSYDGQYLILLIFNFSLPAVCRPVPPLWYSRVLIN